MTPTQNTDIGPTIEEIAIKSLRGRISDIISDDEKFDDDLYLLQWLKVNKLDPENTEPMIRNAVQWRKEQDVESIEEEAFQRFKRVYAAAWGTTRDGRLVAYNPMGKKDYKKGIAEYGKPLWMRLWIKLFFEMEGRMINYNKGKKRPTERITVDSASCLISIQDVKNFSAFQVASLDVVTAGREQVKNLSLYFPLIIDLTLMINMNKIFKVIFKVVKPFLEKPYFTYEMYGTNEAEWRKRLLEIMDEEQLETFLSN